MSQSKPGAGYRWWETALALLSDIICALPFAAFCFALSWALVIALKLAGAS